MIQGSGELVAISPSVIVRPGWGRWFERLEASAGMTATMWLGFAPVLPLMIGAIQALNTRHPVLAVIGGCLALVAAGLAALVAAVAGQAVRACFPEWADDPAAQLHLKADSVNLRRPARSFAIELALSFPEVPEVFRSPLSLWWLLHFTGCAVAAMLLHTLVGVSFPATVGGAVLAGILHFVFLLGSNVYLLLAIGMVVRDEPLLEAVWNARFLLDIVLTAIVVLYSL